MWDKHRNRLCLPCTSPPARPPPPPASRPGTHTPNSPSLCTFAQMSGNSWAGPSWELLIHLLCPGCSMAMDRGVLVPGASCPEGSVGPTRWQQGAESLLLNGAKATLPQPRPPVIISDQLVSAPCQLPHSCSQHTHTPLYLHTPEFPKTSKIPHVQPTLKTRGF